MDFDNVLQSFHLPRPVQIIPLAGGANNRVFKWEFKDQSPLIVKQYFSHPNDPRPRLHSEYSFLEYAWGSGMRNIPQPVAQSQELNTAVYSYIPGRIMQRSDVSASRVQRLIDFFLAINRNKDKGRHLPFASEACKSIKDYMQITEQRLERLKPFASEQGPLSAFLNDCLIPKWHDYKDRMKLTGDFQDFCISPSDFGFHNALIENDEVSFIDFEYAGWDDPCKTVCDLFCQPKVPLPEDCFPLVAQAFSSVVSHSEQCLERIQTLLPAIQMKWCCILLNAFTKVGKERRLFSQSDEVKHLENQLNKAKELFLKIKEPLWSI